MKTKIKKTKTKPAGENGELTLSSSLKKEFLLFIEQHPAKRLSRNLRSMLLDFLMFDGAVEVVYLNDLLYDLDGVFNLLEVIQEEEMEKISGGTAQGEGKCVSLFGAI